MDLNKEIEELKSKMTPMGTVKFIGGTLVSIGAAAAVVAVMKGGLSSGKGLTKLLMKLGIFMISCKVGEVAKNYFEETFSDCEKAFIEGRKEAATDA